MNQRRIQELVLELRQLRKAGRKEKAKRLGYAEKKSGHAYTEGEHEYLADDDFVGKTKRRMEIFRNAGGEVTWFDEGDPWSVEEIRPASCQLCAETHLVGWNEGDWHHACELAKHCDSAKCSLFGCKTGHRVITAREIISDRAERARH